MLLLDSHFPLQYFHADLVEFAWVVYLFITSSPWIKEGEALMLMLDSDRPAVHKPELEILEKWD